MAKKRKLRRMFVPQYGGDKSDRFWRIVNELDTGTQPGGLWSTAVSLQAMEADVLARIERLRQKRGRK